MEKVQIAITLDPEQYRRFCRAMDELNAALVSSDLPRLGVSGAAKHILMHGVNHAPSNNAERND